jgi:hypothetical protein
MKPSHYIPQKLSAAIAQPLHKEKQLTWALARIERSTIFAAIAQPLHKEKQLTWALARIERSTIFAAIAQPW